MRKKILVIEDKLDMQNTNREYLRHEFFQYDIVTAGNMRDGFNGARNPDVCAVITDNNMPRSEEDTGTSPYALTICREIRRLIPHLKNAPLCVFSEEILSPDKTALRHLGVHMSEGKGLDELQIIGQVLKTAFERPVGVTFVPSAR